MQRIASLATVSLLVLSIGSGCSLFGKKKAEAADAYDPNYGAAAPQETYPSTYQPLATDYSGSESTGARFHTVQKKETLYSIARQYYGDQARWKDIYKANQSDIADPNKIRVGQRLAIP